jgi:two-component system phosphate regulon sensor histidine kinase PhoR
MDTGIGIPKEHVNRITERFYRVDKSRSRDTGGTGLGLSIVKHILVRHQAQLKIDSIEHEGSTFSIMFPKERAVLKPSWERT